VRLQKLGGNMKYRYPLDGVKERMPVDLSLEMHFDWTDSSVSPPPPPPPTARAQTLRKPRHSGARKASRVRGSTSEKMTSRKEPDDSLTWAADARAPRRETTGPRY
jgi:hypothetical protein